MEHTECSETSAYKIQTPANYPEESTQQVSGCWNFRRQICDQERSREDYGIKLCNRSTAHVGGENKNDTNKNRGNWNHLKII